MHLGECAIWSTSRINELFYNFDFVKKEETVGILCEIWQFTSDYWVLSLTPVRHLLPKIIHIHGMAKNTCSISNHLPCPLLRGGSQQKRWYEVEFDTGHPAGEPTFVRAFRHSRSFSSKQMCWWGRLEVALCGWGDGQYRLKLKDKFLLDAFECRHMGKRALCFQCVAALTRAQGPQVHLNTGYDTALCPLK